MSSQHLRPLAAFMLVSLVCAMVMIRSFQASGIDPAPGGFAVVDGTRQITTGTVAGELDSTTGPAIERSVSAQPTPSAGSARAASPHRSATAAKRPSAGGRTTVPAPSSSSPADTPSQGAPTATPKPQPVTARDLARLAKRVVNLTERASRASGPQKQRLQGLLREARRELAESIRGGVVVDPGPTDPSPEPGPTEPTPTDPGSDEPGRVDPNRVEADLEPNLATTDEGAPASDVVTAGDSD